MSRPQVNKSTVTVGIWGRAQSAFQPQLRLKRAAPGNGFFGELTFRTKHGDRRIPKDLERPGLNCDARGRDVLVVMVLRSHLSLTDTVVKELAFECERFYCQIWRTCEITVIRYARKNINT
jgi:hypothetical protein